MITLNYNNDTVSTDILDWYPFGVDKYKCLPSLYVSYDDYNISMTLFDYTKVFIDDKRIASPVRSELKNFFATLGRTYFVKEIIAKDTVFKFRSDVSERMTKRSEKLHNGLDGSTVDYSNWRSRPRIICTEIHFSSIDGERLNSIERNPQ